MRSIESRPVEIALGKGKLYILCRSMPSTAYYSAVCHGSTLCRKIMLASGGGPNAPMQDFRRLAYVPYLLKVASMGLPFSHTKTSRADVYFSRRPKVR